MCSVVQCSAAQPEVYWAADGQEKRRRVGEAPGGERHYSWPYHVLLAVRTSSGTYRTVPVPPGTYHLRTPKHKGPQVHEAHLRHQSPHPAVLCLQSALSSEVATTGTAGSIICAVPIDRVSGFVIERLVRRREKRIAGPLLPRQSTLILRHTSCIKPTCRCDYLP